jgi:hypothetical protein
MRARLTRHILSVAVVAATLGLAPAYGQTLYALGEVSVTSIDLRTVDPATGATITVIGQVMIGPTALTAARGMAMDPITGTMYFVCGGTSEPWQLCTVDLATAAATVVGSLENNRVRDLTFDANGQLYGVTGFQGVNPSSIVTIDKGTGAVTLKLAVSGTSEHALAFDPATPDRLYHRGNAVFESVDIGSNAITDIALSGDVPQNATGMVWDPVNDRLVFGDSEWSWFTMTLAGAIATAGGVDLSLPGLAWDQATTVPVELVSFTAE